jgi:hypothetical protein
MEIRSAPDGEGDGRWDTSALVTNVANKGRVEMTQNMGKLDRGLRAFIVAPVAIVLGLLLGAGTVGGIILFVVAGIMLATSSTGFCPTYTIFGISTDPRGLHRVGHGIRHGHA